MLYLKAKQYDVCCIQDTHFVPGIEFEIRREWEGKCFFSFNTSNSRGVAILFKNTLPVNIKRLKVDNTGNFVVLDVSLYEYNSESYYGMENKLVLDNTCGDLGDPDFSYVICLKEETIVNTYLVDSSYFYTFNDSTDYFYYKKFGMNLWKVPLPG